MRLRSIALGCLLACRIVALPRRDTIGSAPARFGFGAWLGQRGSRTFGKHQALRTPLSLANDFQQVGNLTHRHRLAVVEALRVLAAKRPQEQDIIRPVDALRDHRFAKLVRERDDRAHDGGAAGVLHRRTDQFGINLHFVDGKSLKIGQRCIAGAKLIEREADAGFSQLVEQVGGLLGIVHDHRFGHLKLHRPRRKALSARKPAHLLHKLWHKQLAAEYVETDKQRAFNARQLLLPFREFANAGLQDM